MVWIHTPRARINCFSLLLSQWVWNFCNRVNRLKSAILFDLLFVAFSRLHRLVYSMFRVFSTRDSFANIEHVKFCYPVCFRPSDEKSEDTPPAVISSAWQNLINENVVWLRLYSWSIYCVVSYVMHLLRLDYTLPQIVHHFLLHLSSMAFFNEDILVSVQTFLDVSILACAWLYAVSDCLCISPTNGLFTLLVIICTHHAPISINCLLWLWTQHPSAA